MDRHFHFADRLGRFLERADPDDSSFVCELRKDMDGESVEQLLGFLRRQQRIAPLPHRHHLLIETCEEARHADQTRVILHTNWGGRVNRPFALTISAAWEAEHGVRLDCFADNNVVVALLPQDADIASILPAITPLRLEGLLRHQLEHSAFFSGRFREAAGRALLLTRPGFGKRLPLWLNRLRSKKLLESVMPLSDFPILLEAWRECLQDEFDLSTLGMLLNEIHDGRIAISRVTTHVPSPFADLFGQINAFMYHDDTPLPGGASNLRGDLIREVALSEHLRPEIDEARVRELEARLQRTAPGYAPTTSEDLLDWLHERLIIPKDEMAALGKACERNSGLKFCELFEPIADRFRPEFPPPAALVAQVLRFYGPIHPDCLPAGPLPDDIVRLEDGRICDLENFERLLRMQRQRAQVETQSISALAPFIAQQQKLESTASAVNSNSRLQDVLEQLFAYPAPAVIWERDILPARGVSGGLDELLAGTDLLWFGSEGKRLSFALPDVLDLLDPRPKTELPLPATFATLASERSSAEVAAELWAGVWARQVTNDGFAVMRQGLANNFKTPSVSQMPTPSRGRSRRRRPSFSRWQASRPIAGRWLAVPSGDESQDLLEEESRNRERIHLLLDRYGILFRELLWNEPPEFRWGRIFRSLRIMELSGELITGQFFADIPGLQFTRPETLPELRSPQPVGIYWLNAADPASLCGCPIRKARAGLPKRLPGTHLVYHDDQLVLISRRLGKALDIRVAADSANLAEYLAIFANWPKRVIIESINGEPAAQSEYLEALRSCYELTVDVQKIVLWRRA